MPMTIDQRRRKLRDPAYAVEPRRLSHRAAGMKRRREALRAAGLHQVRMLAPDTHAAGFADECRRQSLATASADAADPDLAAFIDAGLADMGDDARA